MPLCYMNRWSYDRYKMVKCFFHPLKIYQNNRRYIWFCTKYMCAKYIYTRYIWLYTKTGKAEESINTGNKFNKLTVISYIQ